MGVNIEDFEESLSAILFDDGVDNRVQLGELGRILKDDGAESATVNRAIGSADAFAEEGDGWVTRRTGQGPVTQQVSFDEKTAELGKHAADGGFAGRQATGEGDG